MVSMMSSQAIVMKKELKWLIPSRCCSGSYCVTVGVSGCTMS